MPLLTKQRNKKQNEIVSNLVEPDATDESTAINPQQLRFQARRKTKTAVIFCEYFKEVKDFEETLGEPLGNLTNIRRHLQGSVPKESGISLKPTKVGSKG